MDLIYHPIALYDIPEVKCAVNVLSYCQCIGSSWKAAVNYHLIKYNGYAGELLPPGSLDTVRPHRRIDPFIGFSYKPGYKLVLVKIYQ
jgi:hypothetical protein